MLTASAAIAVAAALAGCQTDELAQVPTRAMQPLSRDMQALLDKKNMPAESAILVRIFKEESELEVWKQDGAGRFALLKAYPICRWSGELGPKVKQGDRQAPEGFYAITPGQMNPNSKYYLAFNLGFPNAFDRAHDRSGAFLMVHGDCSSSGCYSMSDDQMAEIYALAREAFLGGQKSFQVQAFPFRMTALNLAKHRNSPHMPFWRNLKEGSDHFEVTRAEPKIDVCDRRYVFNAAVASGPFNPRGPCPSYRAPEEIASAANAKRERDEAEFAAHVGNGVQAVAVSSGGDGGMHPAFVAQLHPQTVIDTTGRPAAYTKAGSGLPALVRLPRPLESDSTSGIGSRPAMAQVASADPGQALPASPTAAAEQKSGGFFTRLFGSGGQAAQPEPARKDAAAEAAKAKPSAKPAAAKAAPSRQTAAAAAPVKPDASAPGRLSTVAAPAAGAATGAPAVSQSSGFDNRWGGLR